MRQIHDQQYARFTPNERLTLTLAALARGDKTEADRLWQTCPRYDYRCSDLEYTLRVNALIILGALFFEKCVRHYNLIKKAEIFILSSEQDLSYENEKTLQDFANKIRRLIELANKAQETHISQIKGLFEGFKQFCSGVGLDSDTILKTIPVKECCHDLDVLLGADIEIDLQYMNHIKDFFLAHWNF